MDLLFARYIMIAALTFWNAPAHAHKVKTQMAQKVPDASAQRLLAAHNAERKRVGVKPLVWDQKLADAAAVHAKYLAKTGAFEHAEQAAGEAAQGENLWMGTAQAFGPEDMVKLWVDERAFFKPGRFPDVSTTGDWTEIGHYTQLIWPETTSLGCSLQRGKEDEFLVCRYYPAGNVIGDKLGVK